ncbi:fused MFS/spermidine synthase [Aequorivita lipolytica]|uniref:Spermine synthase n=1 Tax=Aequorivita lipolytica TaxID=153267 RepID=A0A5C6YM79_9FLAO|nr:fused MFS/spermidine synthase [Aequorivita lipolytica]TXD68128.1 spermine synthase [Aequorivita lipolytica]SRX53554.1 Polyamine aminopropyltransferase [Aequorivita lipolytica]
MKKLISYIWPTTRRFSSEINGTLEVTYINGKKVLDTENANYSYGSLQKILEIGLTKVDLKSVENLLLLGMGGGSVINSLKKMGFYEVIFAVELDPEIIKIAKNEFNIKEAGNLIIIQANAAKYVKNCAEKFQLIIIDLFIDIKVPTIFYGKEFCENVSNLLDSDGSIIFNVGINLEKKPDTVQTIISHFGNDFEFQVLPKVNRTNTLLIGKKLK